VIADVVNHAIAGIGFIHLVGRLFVRKGFTTSKNAVMTQIGLDGGINVESGIFPL
jgi:hypothetical protein